MQINLPEPGLAAALPVGNTNEKAASEAELRESAMAFESVFVKQMLQYAGLAEAFGADDSSPVASFSDFVLDKIATDMVEKGGFGLTDDLYTHLQQAQEMALEEADRGTRA